MKQETFRLENPPRILYREEARAKFEELKRTLAAIPDPMKNKCDFAKKKKWTSPATDARNSAMNETAIEKALKALDLCVAYLADLNGSNWIKGSDAGSIDMRQRAENLQEIAYKAHKEATQK